MGSKKSKKKTDEDEEPEEEQEEEENDEPLDQPDDGDEIEFLDLLKELYNILIQVKPKGTKNKIAVEMFGDCDPEDYLQLAEILRMNGYNLQDIKIVLTLWSRKFKPLDPKILKKLSVDFKGKKSSGDEEDEEDEDFFDKELRKMDEQNLKDMQRKMKMLEYQKRIRDMEQQMSMNNPQQGSGQSQGNTVSIRTVRPMMQDGEFVYDKKGKQVMESQVQQVPANMAPFIMNQQQPQGSKDTLRETIVLLKAISEVTGGKSGGTINEYMEMLELRDKASDEKHRREMEELKSKYDLQQKDMMDTFKISRMKDEYGGQIAHLNKKIEDFKSSKGLSDKEREMQMNKDMMDKGFNMVTEEVREGRDDMRHLIDKVTDESAKERQYNRQRELMMIQPGAQQQPVVQMPAEVSLDQLAQQEGIQVPVQPPVQPGEAPVEDEKGPLLFGIEPEEEE